MSRRESALSRGLVARVGSAVRVALVCVEWHIWSRTLRRSFVTRLEFRQRILATDLRLISPLHQRRRRPDLSTSLDFQTFISQHVISLMESSSSTAVLQNAIGTTISGSAQVNTAGRDIVFHGYPVPPAAGMLGFI